MSVNSRNNIPAGSSKGVLQFTDLERKSFFFLVVEPDQMVRHTIRQLLNSLGFTQVSEAQNTTLALQKIEERPFTHLLFDAKASSMPSQDFLDKVFHFDPDIIAIPVSYDPSVDDVFDLLILGARGYIVKPFSESSLDAALIMATKGEPISSAILHAKDRNEALASLIMTAVDRVATVMRQSKMFETAARELPMAQYALKRAVDIGRNFAKGGLPPLVEAVIDFCIERSNGPASKLGRVRKRISDINRSKKKPVASEAAGEKTEVDYKSEAEKLVLTGNPKG